MRLPSLAESALVELAKRRPAVSADLLPYESPEAAAARLRAFYYPKQAAFYRGPKKWRATRKTRRMGATAGGCRELLARAIEQPKFRATYATTTRMEAVDRAWRNDNSTGLVDLLDELGEEIDHPTLKAYSLGGVIVEVRETDLKLEFSNGSQIELFGSENARGQKRKRGNSKHVFWIDEAQDFPGLEDFFDAVIMAAITDYDGEVWLTGTPGRDCAGMFYDVTKEAEDGEEPIKSWDVHEIGVTDNPFFGAVIHAENAWFVQDNVGARTGPFDTADDAELAARTVRYDRTAGAAKLAKGWKGDEPDFIREWLGKWVKADARYVYPVHSVPKHVIQFAPQRLLDNPFVGSHPRFDGHPKWYDHPAAVRDLPRARRGFRAHQWLYAAWFDYGFHPDPFAAVVWAFTPDLPDVYEMFSWKCTRVHTDDQGQYMQLLWKGIDGLVSFGGDAAGKQDDFEVWKTRMNMPLDEARKAGKNTLEEFLADDIRRGRVHLREGSPLYTEMRHLVYLPTKPGKTRMVDKHRKVNGVVHGDHAADASRYGYNDLTHYLARVAPDRPAAGTAAAYAQEEERHERRIETYEEKRAMREEQQLDDREEAMEYQWQ